MPLSSRAPSPQILSGSVALAAGMMQNITLDTMTSRSNRWLRVEELSVCLYSDPIERLGESGNNYKYPLGSIVQFLATAYRQTLVKDLTPVWLMGPRSHLVVEGGGFSDATFYVFTSNGLSFDPAENYRWRFAKPFYLPPKSAFNMQFKRDGSTADVALTTNVNIEVALRCVQVDEAEARAQKFNSLPYLASFVPTAAAALLPAQSNNQDLANPFTKPLFLQRLTARCRGLETRLGKDYNNAVSLKLTDTRTIVADKMPFHALFPAETFAWTFTRRMEANEYLVAQLFGALNATPQVAIVGYRNEVMP